MAGLLVLTLVAIPGTTMADDPDDPPYGDAWRLDEIYFEPPEPVPGRRIYVEKLAVTGRNARVSLRAAHDLDLKVRVFGGRKGRTLKMGANSTFHAGESRTYRLTLNGPRPSFTFSWTDALDFAGAVSLEERAASPPAAQVRRGTVRPGGGVPGVDAGQHQGSRGVRVHQRYPPGGGPAGLRRPLQPVGPALLDATVTGITGTLTVQAGEHTTTVAFTPNGETAFSLAVPHRQATHDLEITAELTATLDVPLPPMLQTVHHPARTDVYTRRVTCRCGESTTVKTVTIRVHHPEHVRAVEVERAPVTRTRSETLPLAGGPVTITGQALGLGADKPFEYLYVPPPKPPPPKAEQAEAGDSSSWWKWPW